VTSARNRIKILPSAAQQITDQADYYRNEANSALAQRWRAAVAEAIRSLWQFAERYEHLETEVAQLQTIRKLRITGFPQHIVFYRWDVETKTVLILSVVHGARDIGSLRID
jgi:plasmid stabilization system protein ParE